MSMTHLGLFEGIGGFSLAARWMGWETLAWCEWNEFGQKILRRHFPEADGFGDITKSDFKKYANRTNIITGGFPCQPFSDAGLRKGTEDDRYLWPAMLKGIEDVQPDWVVAENVLGIINWSKGMVFHKVQADLEAAGYEVWPYVLPACAVNAPHERYRTWFIAHSVNNRHKTGREQETEKNGIQSIGGQEVVTGKFDGANLSSNAPNTNNEGLQRGQVYRGTGKIGTNGKQQPARYFPPDWKEFPTKPGILGGNDGIPNRVDRIKALGNAIVPQVALQIFKAIEQYEITL